LITIVRGNNGLVAIYKDGDLVATQDKFCRQEDIELAIEQRGGGKVKEESGKFNTVAEIPASIKKSSVKKVAEPIKEPEKAKYDA
jgi:hypothetical protein